MRTLIRDLIAATPAGRRASRKRMTRNLDAFTARTVASHPVIRSRTR